MVLGFEALKFHVRVVLSCQQPTFQQITNKQRALLYVANM